MRSKERLLRRRANGGCGMASECGRIARHAARKACLSVDDRRARAAFSYNRFQTSYEPSLIDPLSNELRTSKFHRQDHPRHGSMWTEGCATRTFAQDSKKAALGLQEILSRDVEADGSIAANRKH